MARPDKTEKEIHQVFDLTLVLKGLHAAAEIIGGALLYIVSGESILGAVKFFVGDEIREDPHDVVSNYLLHLAQSFGGSSQSFAAFYLLIHGVINAFIVVELWREKLWAYPVALAVLGGFTAYQVYLFIFSSSLWLIFLTILDLIIIFLVWHEYGVLRKRRRPSL